MIVVNTSCAKFETILYLLLNINNLKIICAKYETILYY